MRRDLPKVITLKDCNHAIGETLANGNVRNYWRKAFAHTNCAHSTRLNTPQTKRTSSLRMHMRKLGCIPPQHALREREAACIYRVETHQTRILFSCGTHLPRKTHLPASLLRQCETSLLHVPGCRAANPRSRPQHAVRSRLVWRGSLSHLGDAASQSPVAHGWVSWCRNWFGTR
jgi:L-ascorbate metabolism protein UlaG (beta-lactamase superfamily)